MYARLRCGGDLPLPRPGVDRPLRGNCHPLSCAPDNQVRCVFGIAPYQKQASTVRNTHSVLKKASCGTRRIFRGVRCKKQASTVRKGYSVPETAFWCTERIFKGALNSRLHRLWTASCRTGRIFRGVPCQKQHLPTGRSFSARKSPRSLCSLRRPLPLPLRRHSVPKTAHRSEVSKYKKRITSKSIKTFQSSPFFYNNQSDDYQKLNFSMACTR